MATSSTPAPQLVPVGPLDKLERDRVKVVTAGGRSIAVFYDEGAVHAVDNRCPHMGFPLHRGTVRDGILTCHWHHAKFDLVGGCTFDPFADDVTSFRAEIRAGEVFVDPTPIQEDRREHWLRKLDEGLEHSLRLVIAKSVIGLYELGISDEPLARAALFAVRNRRQGWSAGLSILTAMANVLPPWRRATAPARFTTRSFRPACSAPASPRTSTSCPSPPRSRAPSATSTGSAASPRCAAATRPSARCVRQSTSTWRGA